MAKIIILIDPNDVNLEELLNEVNLLKPKDLWVGCSLSEPSSLNEVFLNLNTEACLFPGSLGQIKECHEHAIRVYIPNPLFCFNATILEDIKIIRETYLGKEDSEKFIEMNYIVLHPDCSAAKILNIKNKFSDDEVLTKLEGNRKSKFIYLEGGSRNSKFPITEQIDLINKIRTNFPESKLICGGGIHSIDQVKILSGLCDYVLLSNIIHKYPHRLKEFLQATHPLI